MLRATFNSLVTCSVVATSLLLVGCASTTKQMTPQVSFGSVTFQAKLIPAVSERVTGSSTTTNILGGLVQIVDGDHVIFLGIPFFDDKYTPIRHGDMTAQRAYYNALQKTPDADAVLTKSVSYTQSGVPLLAHTEKVTYTGRAVSVH